jgi:chromosome segregation ATPase
VGGLVNIEVSDTQLFEVIGRKEVELYSVNKELEAYRVSLESTKGLATELNALRAAKPALEASNKQLADKNIELDKALTEVRKEREAIRVELTKKTADLETANNRADEAIKNVVLLNQSVENEQKRFAELNQTYTALAAIPQKKSKK